MALPKASTAPQPADGPLITKAFLRAGELLELSQKDLAEIIGVSEAGISRLANGSKSLPIKGKEWELALQFIRLFRSLGGVLGNETTMRAWMNSPNTALKGTPRDLVKTVPGLLNVIDYLDYHRGQV
jgi:DNA-binding XRE family transcriptional regulator